MSARVRLNISTYLAPGWQREILHSSTSLSHTSRSMPFLAAYFSWDSCLETPLKMMSSEGTPRLCTSSSSVWDTETKTRDYPIKILSFQEAWLKTSMTLKKLFLVFFTPRLKNVALTWRPLGGATARVSKTSRTDNSKHARENTLLVQMNPVPRAARMSITVGRLLHLTE